MDLFFRIVTYIIVIIIIRRVIFVFIKKKPQKTESFDDAVNLLLSFEKSNFPIALSENYTSLQFDNKIYSIWSTCHSLNGSFSNKVYEGSFRVSNVERYYSDEDDKYYQTIDLEYQKSLPKITITYKSDFYPQNLSNINRGQDITLKGRIQVYSISLVAKFIYKNWPDKISFELNDDVYSTQKNKLKRELRHAEKINVDSFSLMLLWMKEDEIK